MRSRDQLMDRFRTALLQAGTDADLIEILAGPGYAEACSDDELVELIYQFDEIARGGGNSQEALPLLVFDYKHRRDQEREARLIRAGLPPELRGTGQLSQRGTGVLGPTVPVRPVRLEGPRVQLRELTEADAADVFAYASDEEVTRHLTWGPASDVEDSRKYIRQCQVENQSGLALTLGAEWKAEGRIVGAVSLFNLEHLHGVGEIGFILHRRFWGQRVSLEMIGLMLHYGFTVMQLERIEGWTIAENERSWRIMEKMGMVREGILRRHRIYRDEPKDRVVYGLLRQEWERQALAQ